jgi:AcrR family transcriptional regulator
MAVRRRSEKPYHHGDLREQLLQAAEAALAEMPADQVSLREIARRAGVSHAAPRHHFGTLGELLGEIAARGFERFVAHLDRAADKAAEQSPHARLLAMGRAYLSFAEKNRSVYGLMFGKNDQCARTPHRMEAARRAWDQLEGQVASGIGEAKAKHGALMVWSYVHGLATLKLEEQIPPPLRTQQAFDASFRMLVEGLSAAE